MATPYIPTLRGARLACVLLLSVASWTTAQAQAQPCGAGATLTASPSPCVIGPNGLCTTNLQWNSQSATYPYHQLWVVRGSGQPGLMSCGGATGGSSADWIQEGTPYTFTLYNTASCDPAAPRCEVASATVAGVRNILVRSGRTLTLGGAPYRSIGMNTYNLFYGFRGLNPGKARALKALDDARAAGVGYLRINGGGFYASDLDAWRNPSTRAAYWSAFDEMVDAARERGVKLVPAVWWKVDLWSKMCGEPLARMFTEAQSCSRRLLLDYARELVSRYVANPARNETILFWELTNEMNLYADLGKPDNLPETFTSDQMAAVLKLLAEHLRKHDPSHLISSGYDAPRPTAYHLRACPEWMEGAGCSSATLDTVQQMQEYLRLTHPDPIDIISVHTYNGITNEVLGVRGYYNPDALDHYAAAADAIGKPLFLGEFGDLTRRERPGYIPGCAAPPLSCVECACSVSDACMQCSDRSSSYTRRVLLKLLELRIPLAAYWAWEYYPYNPYVPQDISLEPGQADDDDLIAFYTRTNAWLSDSSAARLSSPVVPNGSFELDANGNGRPDGWETTWSNNASTMSGMSTVSEPDEALQFHGPRMMRLSNGTADAGEWRFAASDPIAVTGGTEVVLSAALRHNLPTRTMGRVELVLMEYSATGALLSETHQGGDLLTRGRFKVEVSRTRLNAQTSSVRIRFGVGGAVGALLDVDDVRLSRVR